MSTTHRHVACKPCRDRKIRCDGTQPACNKCRQSGGDCFYLPIQQRPTKSGLNQTIETLQKRLGEAEARISSLTKSTAASDHSPSDFGSGSNGGGLDNEHGAQPADMDGKQPNSSPSWHKNIEQNVSSSFLCPLTPFTSAPSVDNGVLANGIISNPMLPSYDRQPQFNATDVGGGLLENGHTDQVDTMLQGDFGELDRLDIDMDIAPPSQEVSFRGSRGQTIIVPDSSVASSTFTNNSTRFPHCGKSPVGTGNSYISESIAHSPDQRHSTCDECGTTLNPIKDFMSTIFQSQIEISNLALVSAEYLAWIRNVPSTGGSSQSNLVYTNMLETIEGRKRELQEIAETRHLTAYRNLMTALERTEPCGNTFTHSLSDYENVLKRQSEERNNYFKTKYDACALLSDQQ